MNKIKKYTLYLLAIIATGLVQSCKEEIDTSSRFTLTEYTIASYLEKFEEYSEYYDLLGKVNISKRSESTVLQLMSARGNYTVFAPSNEAIHKYLEELVTKGIISEASWNAFPDEQTLDSIRKVIVYNSIIDGGDNNEAYQTTGFPKESGEEFPISNMNDRKLTIEYDKANQSIMRVNGVAKLEDNQRNIYTINGYIHQVESVIAPSNESVADLLQSFIAENKEGYITAARMIEACGLLSELSKVRDEEYEEYVATAKVASDGHYYIHDKTKRDDGNSAYFGYLPEHKKFGFTLFAETDDFWRSQFPGRDLKDISLSDLEKFAAQYYPNATTDGNYKSEKNALNQFITYHILPQRIPSDKLVIHFNEYGYNPKTSTSPTVPTYEIYTTMGERRLLKLYQCGTSYSCDNSDAVYINRFPVINNGRHDRYDEASVTEDTRGAIVDKKNLDQVYSVINGMIYPIKDVIAYDENTRNNLQKQRLRFDAAALFPEWMTNDIRFNRVGDAWTNYVGFSHEYPYMEDLEIKEGTNFYYLAGAGSFEWENWQGDELNVTGRYEMILRLPPVPKEGTYEIRYAVQTNSNRRGMCQVYFGSDKKNLRAMGIPLDLRMGGLYRKTHDKTFPSIVGWLTDDPEDDDYNAEIDKKMRNNGFMKGPQHYTGKNYATTQTARTKEYLTRRIIVREYMYPDKTYYIKFKSVLENEQTEFYMDYLEFCAKEVYDNPVTPEDIW